MASCISCGGDVTGKKFCPQCGTAVQSMNTPVVSGQICPHCSGEVKPGAAFCMHCGTALNTQSAPPPPSAPYSCPSCHGVISPGSVFCTSCGHDMRVPAVPQVAQASASAYCTACGRQNAPGMRFCGGCGNQLTSTPQVMQTNTGPYTQYPQPQSQYGQPQYPQSQHQSQQYGQPQYAQSGYQPQPMMGQGPMVLRCPVCMAMAPMGTPNCLSCRTSLAGVVPVPAQAQPQGGVGGFLQGSGGQLAMGALGGAAAVIGGEMLLHGIENSVENRVEENMGFGGERPRHHHHHHREEGLLDGLGELAKDIGLF